MQHGGDKRTRKYAEDGVIAQSGEHLRHNRRIFKPGEGAFHLQHSHKQHAERHQNLAGYAAFCLFAEHDQCRADKRHNRCKGGGL